MAVTQNIYLLYFLFFATLVHLGYFVLISETHSLILFSLMFLFVYLIRPNMIIVLGISLLFVDLLYILKNTHEGFKVSKEPMDTKKEKEKGKGKESEYDEDSEYSGDTTTALSKNKIKITPMDETASNSLNLLSKMNLGTSAKQGMANQEDSESSTIKKGGIHGKELQEVNEESKNIKEELEKIKKTPELYQAFNMKYGLDIDEVNKLMNNLTAVVEVFAP
jgi:hypothetical protein